MSKKIIATCKLASKVAVFERYNELPIYLLDVNIGDVIMGYAHNEKLHGETFTIKSDGYFIVTYEREFNYEEFNNQEVLRMVITKSDLNAYTNPLAHYLLV